MTLAIMSARELRHVKAHESACGAHDLKMRCMGAQQEKSRCAVARGGVWKVHGERELQNRTFEWHVMARAVSDGVEASTIV